MRNERNASSHIRVEEERKSEDSSKIVEGSRSVVVPKMIFDTIGDAL